MQTKTVLLILLAMIVALAVVQFQYNYKVKRRGSLTVLLSFLRFLALFGIFILLINPKFSKRVYVLEKPNLVLLVDNSSSVKSAEDTILKLTDSFKENNTIIDQFNLREYSFGVSLNDFDSLSFKEKNTNITKALASLNDIYSKTNTVIILMTDGNQTLGGDYNFYGKDQKFPIYPIVIGDTTNYADLQVNQVNVNRYAFLNNKFPLEAFISYEGEETLESDVVISVNGKNKYREKVTFSESKSNTVIKTVLNASSVGSKVIQVRVSSLKNEKNTANNQKNVAVQVIDEKTNVVVISDILHPDLGALIKSIESNEQRSVFLKTPTVKRKELEEADLFIFYQPNSSFRPVYDYVKKANANLVTITGIHTDWSFLNTIQKRYRIEDKYPVQEIFPVVNPAFSKFDISEFSLEGYPPLESDARVIEVNEKKEVLMNMQIKGISMNDPFIFAVEDNGAKEVVVFGENLWKWRMQSYRDNQNFKKFDDFIGKLMIYLSVNKSKNRLNVDYRSIYEGNYDAKISVTYFDETYIFDDNASITIKIKGGTENVVKEIPMLLKGNYYEADISDLPPDNYDFIVTVKNENSSKSGSFSVSNFDVEQQLVSSDYKKLGMLASNTNGEVYYPSMIESLMNNVTNDKRFVPIQSSTKNVVSLIDFRILLVIIVAALSAEWFIRKYNGLT